MFETSACMFVESEKNQLVIKGTTEQIDAASKIIKEDLAEWMKSQAEKKMPKIKECRDGMQCQRYKCKYFHPRREFPPDKIPRSKKYRNQNKSNDDRED